MSNLQPQCDFIDNCCRKILVCSVLTLNRAAVWPNLQRYSVGVLDTLTISTDEDRLITCYQVGRGCSSRCSGVEDLGNGLKATFNLEAGMGVDDGTDTFWLEHGFPPYLDRGPG